MYGPSVSDAGLRNGCCSARGTDECRPWTGTDAFQEPGAAVGCGGACGIGWRSRGVPAAWPPLFGAAGLRAARRALFGPVRDTADPSTGCFRRNPPFV